MKLLIFVNLFVVLISFSSFSQSDKVKLYLKQIGAGKIDDVKQKLPDLIAENPDDPGVQLLLGIVIDDCNRALEYFKKIVNKYPDSQWADDAYWRIVMYYALKGESEIAQNELANFRKRFPSSEFLNPATDIVRTSVQISKSENASKYVKATNDIEEEDNIATKPKSTETAKNNLNKNASNKAVTGKTTSANSASKEKAAAQKPASVKTSKENAVKPTDKKSKDKSEAKEDTPASEKIVYGLQVGIYSTREAAEAEKERFHKQRLRTNLLVKTVDGQKMYAVVIGEYSSLESAEAAKKIVQQQCKCNPIVFKK